MIKVICISTGGTVAQSWSLIYCKELNDFALRLKTPALSFCASAVLCADRVGQMTKTYSDIDAVTRLLEEVRACREKPARVE